MAQLISRLTATIALGASLSDALNISSGSVSYIELPATWTTAVLTFQGSLDGTNYFNIFDDEGYEVIVFVEAGRRVHVQQHNINQNKYIKLRSGTSFNAVNQAAARTIYVEVWNE